VVVFKNPQDNHQNYIKRLIAVPGETVEIVHGDIYVKSEGDETFRIRRKPRRVQEVMWQIIHAGDYPPEAGLFERYNQQRGGQSLTSQWFPFWRPDPGQVEHWEGLDEVPVSGGMAAHRVGRGVEFLGSDQPVALRFDADRRNFLPNYGYNHSDASKNPNIDSERDVISDLRLAVSYAPSEADSELILHLSSFDHRFRARIRAGGQVALEHQQIGYAGQPDTPWEVWDEASVLALTGRISRVALTHVDYRATVWVDGKAVARSSEAQYDADYQQVKDRVKIQERINELSRRLNAFGADAQELRRRQSVLRAQRDAWFKDPPEVRILAGGGACRLRHLKLQRDVYYTNSSLPSMEARHPLLTYAAKVFETDQDLRARLEQNRQIPNGWGVMDHPLALDDHPGKHDLDEFYVLGDNSPQSHDSRSWVMASPTLRLFDDQGRSRYKLGTVPRYNILGRAMFVYWPAGFAIPKLNVPLIPNVGRMRFIK
jgi:type IV secretory pathway protease TraF